jgi:F0F1-type ATP synthase delta subunit
MEKVYAAALQNMRATGAQDASLVDGLIAHLSSKGRLKLLPGILRELKKKQAGVDRLAPVLEIASADEKADSLAAAKALGIEPAHVHVNHTLGSGWRVRGKNTTVDHSAKESLVRLYRNIVGHH